MFGRILKGIRDLKVVADGADPAIFRLDAEGSPYEEGDRLIRQRGLMTKIFPFEVSVEEGRPTRAGEVLATAEE